MIDFMKDNITRILIESTVKKALKDAEDSPERSVRNLVEVGLEMVKGRFQQYFIGIIYKMLQQEKGAYYSLIKDLLSNVNHEIILNFGMNVGYNSCTIGARKIDESKQFNTPWTLSLYINTKRYQSLNSEYQEIIKQGKALGIFTYFLYIKNNPVDVLGLIKKNTDCAFLLVCNSTSVDEIFVDNVKVLTNVMICLQDNGMLIEACQLLRKNMLLYAIYMRYGLAESDDVQINAKIREVLWKKPSFILLRSDTECSNEIQEKNYNRIIEIRKNQIYPAIVTDVVYDSMQIDRVISEDGVTVEFLENGMLKTPYRTYEQLEYNIFKNSLMDILKLALPKKEQSVP